MATINVRLSKNFTTQLNKLNEKYGEEFARLNGLSDGELSYTDFIDNFIDTETVADASIDSSSNVSTKYMNTLMNEMPKPHRKLLCLHKIYYEINKKYGFKTANEWLEKEWTRALYMHDADTSTFKHYCFAYDLKDLAEKGLFFIDKFGNEPAKHYVTFIDFVKEYISFAANLSSGAVGLPNLIPYMYYFWKKDCDNHYLGITEEYFEKFARQGVQRFVYAVNQPYVRDGIQSAFTNVSIFDGEYLEALFGGAEFPDGTFMIDYLDEIKEFQKLFMEEEAKIRNKNMFTFPVYSLSLVRKNGKFVDEDFAKWGIKQICIVNEINKGNQISGWYDSNIFQSDSVTSLSNCCRLKSNIDDLGYFNSIGGTALKVGSVKVSTINLARLALEHPKNEKGYLVALRNLVELNCKALDVQRHIIQRNVEKNLLPNFTKGLVDFEHLYSTIGFIGIYETMKTFGYIKVDEFGNTFYTNEANNFGKKIFEVIHRTKEQFALDKDYKINCEQIPGESAAAKLKRADAMLFGDAAVDDLPLYGNQFIPLGIKTTIQERIRIASLFDSYCNGGSICHINIDAPFDSFEKAWDMVNYICDQGLTYFAFNAKIGSCKNNHAFYGDTCPVCGLPKTREWSRIVGYYTATDTWSADRKEEYKMREWENTNG
jgi:ribonucleoside-triphosphate reductase